MTLLSIFKDKMKWDEPLGLTELTATLTGSFANIAPSPEYKKFFYYLSWYHLFMFVFFEANVVLAISTADDYFNESLEALRFFVTGIHIFAKYMTMRVMEKQYLELIEQIREAWRTYEESNGDFLAKTLASANRKTIILFLVIGNTIIVSVLGAISKNAGNPQEIQYPLQCWVPALLRTSFVAGSLYQLVPFSSPLMIYAMNISFLNSITSHVEALGLALAREMRSQKGWRGEGVRSFYMKHQEVIRIVERVNDLMASNWAFEMLCSTLQLTVVSYEALRILKRNDIEIIIRGLLLLVNVLVIFIIYGNGNRIIKMGEELHDSLYDTNWYEATVKERKNVLLMMCRTSQPMEYRFKTTTFDLHGFTKVVNSVFSYLAVLRSIDEPEDQGAL